ncbi:hypothetical protein GLX70_07195 [Listeria monocytogenes]|uniref:hypothetical protein n=2 Tax=Listeriaceae TaxID=186820 RepID=UPI000BDEC96E|nr:hypothetical protein [Listeria monocytogenes]MBM5675577.1 hypothetical protein [Listeria seeligeri]EAC5079603.1 hypothetical protein [Listeria monocytogenes]EAC6159087.1 hypothetical protein [Listeria monocytogenes]EAC7675221.1 hypothetical protein [Listeria monocytogenes]EAC7684178.1 hypothetical protein [Listeria monocytogenes]
MGYEELSLFDLMDYYPSQQEEKKRREEKLKPVKTHENDRLDYTVAIAEIERIIGKKVMTVSGFYNHILNKEIRWLFNFETGFCYINDKCQLYEMEVGPKDFQYRGKVHEEVFYSADERKRATKTIK